MSSSTTYRSINTDDTSANPDGTFHTRPPLPDSGFETEEAKRTIEHLEEKLTNQESVEKELADAREEIVILKERVKELKYELKDYRALDAIDRMFKCCKYGVFLAFGVVKVFEGVKKGR